MSTAHNHEMLFRKFRLVLVIAAITQACSKEARRDAAIPKSDTRAAASAVASADPDTIGCGTIPKRQFAEPDSLVTEWVRRDTLGYFLTPDNRLFELTACPGHLGGGDEIVVATEPHVQRLAPVGDSAVFLITYHRFGLVHSDSTGDHETFEPTPGVDSVITRVVSTPWGWRFPFDVANPHLSPRVTLERVQGQWNAAARDSVKALADRLARP